ncbi:AMP-dependent synthetase and ligase [Methanocorpusculum labreanum Z]|uniref:AMP-dependent synthetase and ligase n=1 Tax=Methanocorpusculum labreanum (strain ATCC 43576 / DSM 4855 / Z) TaxID=410358 RepID=A2SSW9_METLZ|nr:AMP-binding protein [Methanocorpusculum labreanum]ABN07425.1 AMP-dependent synthetase and ligase [Methanocorpusculum labreanum Z]
MTEATGNIGDYEETYKTFAIDVPKHYNFAFDVIDAWAKRDRNHLAMIWTNQDGEEKKFTFWDMMVHSNEAANILMKFGIQKGDRVLLMLPRVPEWWILVLGIMKLGAVYSPSPHMLTVKDIAYRIKVGGFKMVITDSENMAKVDEVATQCPHLQLRMIVDDKPGEKVPIPWIGYQNELKYPAPVSTKLVSSSGRKVLATDPMLIYFTSGTTKDPKMVLHDYAHPLGQTVTAKFWHDLTEHDVHFTVSDTGWAKCGWGKIYGQWICGACIFVYDYRTKFHATELLPLIERYGITSFCAPPTIYRMLIIADLKKFSFSELRTCTSAGEPLNPEVIRIWREGTGLTIREGYGQTETCCCIATLPGMEVKQGSMGKPVPGWHIQLHDDDGKEVEKGDIGKIAVSLNPRPVGLVREYLNNPEENAAMFVNGWYYTGDKARIDDDGYYWFVGRNDDVIKSSGYRISPFEVESTLLEHPAVKESAVVGSPDEIRGMVIKAFIVLHEGYAPTEKLAKEIQEYVKRTTAPYKYPRLIEFLPELPKSFSGKIRRGELRDREMKRFETEGNGDQ